MLRYRLLTLLFLVLFCASPLLAQEEKTGNAPDQDGTRIYEVQKGDTLWGISRKFIEDPYYWPDLWANNPEILNPHVITPGQKLRIYSTPIMVVGVEPTPAAPPVPVTPVTPETATPPVAAPPVPMTPVPVAAEPTVTVRVPAGVGYISEEELTGAGTLYDFTVSRELAAVGDTVFVRLPAGSEVHIGDRFDLIKKQGDVLHPLTRKHVGFQVDRLGILEITALGKDLQTAVIIKNFQEIERGAVLIPLRATRQKIALRRADADLSGVLLSSSSHKELQGVNDVVFIDIGENQGIKSGNLLTVTRSRHATDAVKGDFTTRKELSFPDELVGFALVVDTNTNSSTAVMIKSLAPAVAGDRVRTQIGAFTR